MVAPPRHAVAARLSTGAGRARRRRRTGRGPTPAAGFAHHAGAATGRASLPDRASASMCRTGARGSVSQDFLTASLAFRAVPPGSTPNAAAIDAASACGRATIRQELGDVGEVDTGARRPQPAATARRRRRRIAESTLRGVQPAGIESRRPGLESRPQETRSNNVNGHEPDRDTRPRPSARRLEKEAATGAMRLRRSARRHRPPPSPAAVEKETP